MVCHWPLTIGDGSNEIHVIDVRKRVESVRDPPEELEAVQRAWLSLLQAAKAAGVLLWNNGLSPVANATTVRVREGKSLITDGPFAETHEQLGGFFLLECKDLDEALRWAEKIPHAKYGSVEVRPLWSEV